MGEYFKKLIEHYASECSEERMIKLGNVRGAFTDVLIYPKQRTTRTFGILFPATLLAHRPVKLARTRWT